MKKIIVVLVVILFSCVAMLSMLGDNSDFLRLHVRANSDMDIDQNVKLQVRDGVLCYLSNEMQGVNLSTEESIKFVQSRLGQIKKVSDEILSDLEVDYKSSVSLGQAYFPTRMYGEQVFGRGVYNSLTIELGDGTGGNWWCVVYPPLCFINGQDVEGEQMVYKSKIAELIKNYN